MKALNKIFIIFFSCSIFFVGLSFAASSSAASATPEVKAKLLFVLLSQKGEISQNEKNKYKLTLEGVNPKVTSFTDRPMRVTSKLSLQDFVNKWVHGSFKTNPPNAVMQAIKLHTGAAKDKAKTISFAIELQSPHYHPKNNTLTFDITELKGDVSQLPKMQTSDYVALFIDAYKCSGSSCW